MSRVLVTGGAGFMGSQLVRTLVASGHDVVVYDKLTYAGNLAFLEGVPHTFIQGDVCDAESVAAALDGVMPSSTWRLKVMWPVADRTRCVFAHQYSGHACDVGPSLPRWNRPIHSHLYR